jgi:2-polyprenyl-6-hydroxyphenyl methylase/3-demethylubiquinone-9 3-methyltransferase
MENLESLKLKSKGERIFEIGCGNGTLAQLLTNLGYDITGIDASHEGIQHAMQNAPKASLHQASVYDDLVEQFGTFQCVISFEVVEHLFEPRQFAKNAFRLLQPGGTAIISTPYHGYFKNLAIALSGKFDKHFTALWDGGHIKFWSVNTLTTLLEEAGFRQISFRYAGRRWPLSMSMIAIAKRPGTSS